MDEVPQLTRKDVADALERRFASDRLERQHQRPRTLLAYYGRGQADAVEVQGVGEFEIVPVQSELDLRLQLPSLAERERRMVFLVPWSGQLPLDIQGRFAADGRIHRIGKEARLRRLFGVTDVAPAAYQSPLANYLTHCPPEGDLRAPGGVLTEADLWCGWLRSAWALPVHDKLAADALLAWAALDGRGAQFARAMQHSAAAGVREALAAFLEQSVGVAAPHVFRAWERGEGRALLQWSVLFEALADSTDAAVRLFMKQSALALIGGNDEQLALRVARELGSWTDGALRFAVSQLAVAEKDLRVLLQEADKRAVMSEIRQALHTSRRLPSGWAGRVERLGQALRHGAEARTPEALESATVALRALERHEFFQDPERRPLVEKGEMATRLLAWLVTDPRGRLQESLGSASDVDLLGRWYVEEGGYVDRARHVARAPGEGVFGRGVQAVLDASDALRRELDRRFARALVAWVGQGRTGTSAIPIDRAVDKVGVRFLSHQAERNVLVVLMDGMGWAQAVELLESMAGQRQPWGPIAWHTSAKGALGEGTWPLVLANQPTLTEISRAAFFAGKPMPAGKETTTDKDVERWREHPALAPFFSGTDAPRLLLRGEGHGAEGNLSSAARELVRDGGQRVVAIVVNAIDASLKADSQQRHRWALDDVKSLRELLEVAHETGRTVLLCSDHGHVPADVMKSVGKAGGGARWRPWTSPEDPVEEYEVALRGEGVWSRKGTHGAVLLADDTTCYMGVAHAGEHGGATLAEVVTPCLLLRCDDGAPALDDDPGLRVRGFAVPAWWHYDVQRVVVELTAEPAPKRPAKAASTRPGVDKSLTLPGMEQAVAPVGKAPRSLLSPLVDNPLLAAQAPDAAHRARVIEVVHLLHVRGGACSDAVLADALKEMKFRIGGLLSRVEEALNVEAYPVLQYDRSSKQVKLNVALLEKLFEVKL